MVMVCKIQIQLETENWKYQKWKYSLRYNSADTTTDDAIWDTSKNTTMELQLELQQYWNTVEHIVTVVVNEWKRGVQLQMQDWKYKNRGYNTGDIKAWDIMRETTTWDTTL